MVDLRRGWTTGACAAAAARAACERLFTGRLPDPVAIDLPHGLRASFPLTETGAWVGVRKDAGDDPDTTHGAIVRARLRPAPPGTGVAFRAGPGVGTVTLPGLPLAVGEPAINPGPRAMVAANLRAVADEYGMTADLTVEIGIEGGEALAHRTANARLGIVGGLSVLGTTGVVIPYSCAAWVHAVHRGVDVARAAGLDHVGAATGRGSEAALQARLGLPDHAMIDMGDFAGALLKYLRRKPVARLSLAGGFGKLSKLAAGHLDLHADRSPVDIPRLAAELTALGGPDASGVVSAGAVLALAGDLPLAQRIAEQARETARAVLAGGTEVDVHIFDRRGRLVGTAPCGQTAGYCSPSVSITAV